jgi:hypothetical protein
LQDVRHQEADLFKEWAQENNVSSSGQEMCVEAYIEQGMARSSVEFYIQREMQIVKARPAYM